MALIYHVGQFKRERVTRVEIGGGKSGGDVVLTVAVEKNRRDNGHLAR
jgi:hypothetical protein